MLTDKLFKRVLIAPVARKGVDRLRIVSGFASHSMANSHMEKIKDAGKSISIDLIIGMTKRDGISRAQHVAFQRLAKQGAYGSNFNCWYLVADEPVHAKTYCWLAGDRPIVGFAGSANYTSIAFHGPQIEAMTETSSVKANEFWERIFPKASNCLSPDIESQITFSETSRTLTGIQMGQVVSSSGDDRKSVKLSLLDQKTGETPKKSGINWGQRSSRDKNQAYINIPSEIQKSGFFPSINKRFKVITDDEVRFIMARQQDSGKGLVTPESNALLGEYLRTRMGLPSGEFVTRQHLVEYGRTNVKFTKIDDKNYYLDFHPRQAGKYAES